MTSPPQRRRTRRVVVRAGADAAALVDADVIEVRAGDHDFGGKLRIAAGNPADQVRRVDILAARLRA